MKRENIVEVMKFYKIDINIIRNIIEIYNQDHTNMKIRSDMNIRFDITSGIRQGCNLSATIFKMITYRIMDEIEQKGEGYYIEDIKINSIFYADDALILNNDMQDVRKNLKVLKETSLKYGLEINTEKSKMIVFNKKEKVDEIYNIKEVDQINYLGIIIDNKRNIFHKYKLNILEKAKRLENQTYGILIKNHAKDYI